MLVQLLTDGTATAVLEDGAADCRGSCKVGISYILMKARCLRVVQQELDVGAATKEGTATAGLEDGAAKPGEDPL